MYCSTEDTSLRDFYIITLKKIPVPRCKSKLCFRGLKALRFVDKNQRGVLSDFSGKSKMSIGGALQYFKWWATLHSQKIQAYLCVNSLVLLLSLTCKVRSFHIINLVIFAMENNNGIGGLGHQPFERKATHHYTAHKNSTHMFNTILHLNQTMEIGANISNNTLPADMIFGAAHIIKISAYTPLFFISAFLNLRVLWKLWHKKHSTNGLSRLNQLLMHLVLADLSVSSNLFVTSKNETTNSLI